MAKKHLKCVVVGDSSVGKTCLLNVYCNDLFEYYQRCYFPEPEFCQNIFIGDSMQEFEICDTPASQISSPDEFAELRQLKYYGAVSEFGKGVSNSSTVPDSGFIQTFRYCSAAALYTYTYFILL